MFVYDIRYGRNNSLSILTDADVDQSESPILTLSAAKGTLNMRSTLRSDPIGAQTFRRKRRKSLYDKALRANGVLCRMTQREAPLLSSATSTLLRHLNFLAKNRYLLELRSASTPSQGLVGCGRVHVA